MFYIMRHDLDLMHICMHELCLCDLLGIHYVTYLYTYLQCIFRYSQPVAQRQSVATSAVLAKSSPRLSPEPPLEFRPASRSVPLQSLVLG